MKLKWHLRKDIPFEVKLVRTSAIFTVMIILGVIKYHPVIWEIGEDLIIVLINQVSILLFTFVYINSNIWWQKNFASDLWNMYFSCYMKEKTTKNIGEKCLYANQVKTKRKQVFWNLSTLNRPIVQGIYRIYGRECQEVFGNPTLLSCE